MRFIPSAVQLVLLPGKESFYYSSKFVIAAEGEHNRCLYIDLILGNGQELCLLEGCRFYRDANGYNCVSSQPLHIFPPLPLPHWLGSQVQCWANQHWLCQKATLSWSWTLSKAWPLSTEFKIWGNVIILWKYDIFPLCQEFLVMPVNAELWMLCI